MKQIWRGKIAGKRLRGNPKKRWKDQVLKDMATMGITEKDAENREKWRRFVGEAKYHLGYTWPWE